MNEPVRPESKSQTPSSPEYCPRCGFPLGREAGEYLTERMPMVYKAQIILPSLLIIASIVILANGRGSLGVLLLVMGVIWLHVILLMPYWRR